MLDYEVKIANTQSEIEKAMELRFEVFKLEMEGKNQLNRSFKKELDADEYDQYCQHLIVIDKNKDLVVGTYRLCLSTEINKTLGFYSEKIFDIANIKKINDKMLELGRSCVHKDYRDQLVISLLWSGIAKYISDHKIRFLFGSVRLANTDPKEVSKTFSLIKEKYYAPDKFRVKPWPQNAFRGLEKNIKLKDPHQILKNLPPLVKGYLRLGVKVCGEPAINPQLGSVVLCILLDIEKMTPSYKRHFFGVSI